MDEEPTIIQIVKGDDNSGARRFGLTEAQKAGLACLVCRGTDDVTKHVGWIGDVSVKVHTYHLINYQHGETLD